MATAPKRVSNDPEAPVPQLDRDAFGTEERGGDVLATRSADPQPREATEYTHEHPTFEQIAAEAYAIYSGNGSRHGRDLDDWLEAERRLHAKRT